jgi:hypothetical protein
MDAFDASHAAPDASESGPPLEAATADQQNDDFALEDAESGFEDAPEDGDSTIDAPATDACGATCDATPTEDVWNLESGAPEASPGLDASDGASLDGPFPDDSESTIDTHMCGSALLASKGAIASSFQAAGTGGSNTAFPAGNAVDNNFTTRWGSALQVDPSWIYMDFGAPVFVEEVDVIWQNACATTFDIDISADASHWTVMKAVTGNTAGEINPPTNGWSDPAALKYAGLSGRGRYVRINGTSRCLANYGYSIWEMRALGDTDSACIQ